MAEAGATVEPERKLGIKVEPEPKINNFGSATLLKSVFRSRNRNYLGTWSGVSLEDARM